MIQRREFLRQGALFVSATAYSFLWAPPPPRYPVMVGGKRAFLVAGGPVVLVEGDGITLVALGNVGTARQLYAGKRCILEKKEDGLWTIVDDNS